MRYWFCPNIAKIILIFSFLKISKLKKKDYEKTGSIYILKIQIQKIKNCNLTKTYIIKKLFKLLFILNMKISEDLVAATF